MENATLARVVAAAHTSTAPTSGVWRQGEIVDVFYRAHDEENGNIAQLNVCSGEDAKNSPLVFGMSAGWLRAEVLEDTHELDVLRHKRNTWVPLCVNHPCAGSGGGWVGRGGHPRGQRTRTPSLHVRAHPRLLRRRTKTSAGTSSKPQAPSPPPAGGAVASSTATPSTTSAAAATAASFLVVRWGGSFLVAHGEGGGAWGAGGCTISDTTITAFFDDAVAPRLGLNYRVLTLYAHCAADLSAAARVMNSVVAWLNHPPGEVLPAALKAETLPLSQPRTHTISGLYYLWPTHVGVDATATAGASQQRHPFAASEGFVPSNALLGFMGVAESQGIRSCFPHPLPLYQVLLSKHWQAELCLDPAMRLPATTTVTRGDVARDALQAARGALDALEAIRAARGGQINSRGAGARPRGVVKLGYSWQAVDVRSWEGTEQLAGALRTLLLERGPSTHCSALVQDWVEHDCEMRLFFVAGCQRHADFTRFETPTANANGGTFVDADFGVSRAEALRRWFADDEPALAHAEAQAAQLAQRLMVFLRAAGDASVPPALRVDVRLCYNKHAAAQGSELAVKDRITVSAAELTELGFSMHGWPDGPRVVREAILDTCLCLRQQEYRRMDDELASTAPPRKRCKGQELPASEKEKT